LDELGWILAAVFALAWAVWWVRRALRRWRGRTRVRRAVKGERAAESLLERAGYRIDERQPELEWPVQCGGVVHPIVLRADLLVSRGQYRYVAEVKTGERAPSISTAATRRQLLEYAVAYDVDGVLLVDMEARTINEIEFGA
jgi:hypothetical protein